MKKKIISILFLLTFFNYLLLTDTPSASKIEETIYSKFGTSNFSISLRSMDSGKLVFEKAGDFGIKPASTLKLLTAASALEMLGEDYRFITEVYMDGKINGNVLEGDLYIKGGGDPTLQEENFISMANALKRLGVESVSGSLYGDDFNFIGSQLTPGISTHDETYYYASRTSALTMSPDDDYDAGTIIVKVIANTVGKTPTIEVEPNFSGMEVLNQAKTVGATEKNTIEIYRQNNSNKIVITGNIPTGKTKKEWISLYDPTLNTLYAIKNTFKENGIAFTSSSKVNRKLVPNHATLIYTKKSMPLEQVMIPFLKLSNNSIANILVKTMGYEVYGIGSLEHGLQVMKDYSKRVGLQTNRWYFEDGSGMSHQNKVTANEMTNLLYKLSSEPYYSVIYNSLPVGGHPDRLVGGSLRERFKSTFQSNRVFAKTGHISGVYSLSGYLKAKSGKYYAFTILSQNQSSIKLQAIDEVVQQFIETY